jgi:hypothetical protein
MRTERTPLTRRPLARGARPALLLLVLSLSGRAALACTDPPVLHAALEGDSVRLTWTGTLEAGEAWAVYRGDLGLLHGSGGDVSTLRASGPATEHVDGDPGTWYWRVRCEGGATPGPWSNMGFRLDTDLSSGLPDVPMWRLLSLPSWPGLPDVGSGADGWPCDEPGDGAFTSRDLACDLWSSRDATSRSRFSVEWVDSVDCAFEAAHGDLAPGRAASVLGTLADFGSPPLRGAGIGVRLASAATSNPVSLVGAHDPDDAGYVLTTRGDTCFFHVVSVPYHCVYRSAEELLCGVEGVDWVRDMRGDPDRCENGIFDPVSGAAVSVTMLSSSGWFQSRTAVRDPLFGQTFAGASFAVVPGDAYVVVLSAGYQDRLFRPPTY